MGSFDSVALRCVGISTSGARRDASTSQSLSACSAQHDKPAVLIGIDLAKFLESYT